MIPKHGGAREAWKCELIKTRQLQRGGKLADGGREGKGRRLSLSFLCPAHSVQTCRWRRGGGEEGGGGSAVFSRTSFLCVGLIGAEWGKESTIQLAVSTKHPSLQNTHTHTHTLWQRSCTQFPAWESERRKKKRQLLKVKGTGQSFTARITCGRPWDETWGCLRGKGMARKLD